MRPVAQVHEGLRPVSFRYTRRNENFVLVTFMAVATTAECWHWALRSNVSANSGLGL